MKYEFWGNKKLGLINNPSILDTQKYLFLKQKANKTYIYFILPRRLYAQITYQSLLSLDLQ